MVKSELNTSFQNGLGCKDRHNRIDEIKNPAPESEAGPIYNEDVVKR